MKRTVLVAPALVLTVLVFAFPARPQTGLLVPTSTGRPDPSVLSLREMAIDVGLARGYARVSIRQVFENHTRSIQEGTWRFALPPSGAVGDFAVWDGPVRIPGVILEKRRARAIYRDLTTQRIDPGLLQQGEEEDRAPGASGRAADRPSGGAVFSVKVAPIPALGTKRLEMAFQQELPWVDGVAELRIPLRPGDGEPMTAASLEVRVVLLDGTFAAPVSGSLELTRQGGDARFSGKNVALAKDLVVRFTPTSKELLALDTFRNPSGALPDGLALAPWERPSEIPPEKDGFFLLEYRPAANRPVSPTAARVVAPATAPRPPLSVAFLFDTSLSHRWGGLEAAYATLVKLLDALRPEDRFVLIPFDRAPARGMAALAAATPVARQDALRALRARPLSPGTDVAAAVRAAASALSGAGPESRIVLLTDGAGPTGDLNAARGAARLFTVLTGEERREGYSVASAALVTLREATASSEETADETLFLRQLFAAAPREGRDSGRRAAPAGQLPFTVTGGDPKLRDVYAVMTQPPAAGSLSGWIGRYGMPVASASVTWKGASPAPSVTAPFPETALESRDLPRRWARARVDDLLRRIELEGEKREWVDEILELSRRYKFVTPYTAFLAAPRSLLRPRRIQPGDPLIRIEADAGIVSATALLGFGTRVELVHRPATNLWEGRFLVPEGLADGRYPVRLVLRDRSGRTIVETKHVVLDGTPPVIRPSVPPTASAGSTCLVAARTDADVVFLSARLDDGPPVPLRWDPKSQRSTVALAIPSGPPGRHELFFEATDGAGNHGFARAPLEVR